MWFMEFLKHFFNSLYEAINELVGPAEPEDLHSDEDILGSTRVFYTQ